MVPRSRFYSRRANSEVEDYLPVVHSSDGLLVAYLLEPVESFWFPRGTAAVVSTTGANHRQPFDGQDIETCLTRDLISAQPVTNPPAQAHPPMCYAFPQGWSGLSAFSPTTRFHHRAASASWLVICLSFACFPPHHSPRGLWHPLSGSLQPYKSFVLPPALPFLNLCSSTSLSALTSIQPESSVVGSWRVRWPTTVQLPLMGLIWRAPTTPSIRWPWMRGKYSITSSSPTISTTPMGSTGPTYPLASASGLFWATTAEKRRERVPMFGLCSRPTL